MQVLGVFLGLVTLIVLSYIGAGMIPTSLVAAVVVIFTNNMNL